MIERGEVVQQWMERRRGLGGATDEEWLAAAAIGAPAVYGWFRDPTEGEAAIALFWFRTEQRWSQLMVCQHLARNLWCNVLDPLHVFEWPDEDVLVLSAASRIIERFFAPISADAQRLA